MYNRAILVGRLTADPELKQTPSGTSVCSFTLAVGRKFQKNGEREADFLDIVAWRGTAEFVCKHFRKGQKIGVEGSIQARSYTDREGTKRRAWEVVADGVFFVESKRTGQGDADFTPIEAPDDLPFD